MRKKASDEARLTINLGPTGFSQLKKEASAVHIPVCRYNRRRKKPIML